MRKSGIFFIYLGINLVIMCLLFIHASYIKVRNRFVLSEKAELVKRLELTDLVLFTEARYTRHLSQADLNTPFQDSPLSFEHFPSGSIIMPPAHVSDFYASRHGSKSARISKFKNELYR
ncbi:MAG: hypothetical protein QMD44_04040 [Thermodesulfovibrionales bacterium]|jgi:hypothetical protein|nr:hypothetical protein [Thermodesulfovibrionales bacterium]